MINYCIVYSRIGQIHWNLYQWNHVYTQIGKLTNLSWSYKLSSSVKIIPHGIHSRQRASGSWNWQWNTRCALVLKDFPHVLQASWSGTEFTGMHTCDFRARWEAQCRPQTMQTWSNLASWEICTLLFSHMYMTTSTYNIIPTVQWITWIKN
jgi:hypothetical protein